jgi:hypothetical protein
MDIAQRGTSFPAIGAGTYMLDRWRSSTNATSAVITASQQSDVPSSNEFQNSLRLAVTTADTTIASADQVNIQQRIEGYNVRDLIGRTFTLSFWVRSSKTGTHCVYLQNDAQDRSYVVEYTVGAANTWEQKSITVSGGLITAGTWNWTTGVGLLVGWTLAAGSSLQTTAGAWQTGIFLATSNQVNCLDAVNNIFAITGVQLEVGSVATPFEHRLFGAELALAQRYYCKTFDYSVAPANNTGNRNGCVTFTYTSSGGFRTQWVYPVEMRSSPTLASYNPNAANASWRDITNNADYSAITGIAIGTRQTDASASASAVGGAVYMIHLTASAEL